jgi:hypothetical protein
MSELVNELTRMKGCSYQIWDYQLNRSVLTNIHITISNVGYFQFPSHWEGDFLPCIR